jgi:hypothetical protein
VVKQRLLSAMLQDVGEHAAASAAAGGFDRKEAGISRKALRLDEQGWKELADAAKRWAKELETIDKAVRKRAGAADEAADAGVIVMLYEAAPLAATRRPRR